MRAILKRVLNDINYEFPLPNVVTSAVYLKVFLKKFKFELAQNNSANI